MNPEPLANEIVATLKEKAKDGHHYKLDFQETVLTEYIVISKDGEIMRFAGLKIFLEGKREGMFFDDKCLQGLN